MLGAVSRSVRALLLPVLLCVLSDCAVALVATPSVATVVFSVCGNGARTNLSSFFASVACAAIAEAAIGLFVVDELSETPVPVFSAAGLLAADPGVGVASATPILWPILCFHGPGFVSAVSAFCVVDDDVPACAVCLFANGVSDTGLVKTPVCVVERAAFTESAVDFDTTAEPVFEVAAESVFVAVPWSFSVASATSAGVFVSDLAVDSELPGCPFCAVVGVESVPPVCVAGVVPVLALPVSASPVLATLAREAIPARFESC